jgi:hypothetical protein
MVLIVALIGIPALILFVVITGGVILLPVEGLVLLAPLALLHYLLWGRAFSRQAAGHVEAQALAAADESPLLSQ